MSDKFVIIDGSSLVHRAFYALPILTTAAGQYTNAVYGFASMLLKLVADIKPDFLGVAFDKSRVTFRNDVYCEYKANRKATPTELVEQFPLVRAMLEAFGVMTIEREGFEADDLIGTLAVKAARAGMQTLIVTGDRDAFQLIGPKIRVMLTKKGISEMEEFDEAALGKKYGLCPSQVVDLKGLMGDTADNIPGVPGVGEKTAVKLLAQFGTVENLLKNIDKIAGAKLQDKVRNNVDLARLSKQLATIDCDVPLDFKPADYLFKGDYHKLGEFFAHYEIKSLQARLGELTAVEDEKDPANLLSSLPEIPVVGSKDQMRELSAGLCQSGSLILFPLISGKAPDLQVEGIAFADADGKVWFAPGTTEVWPEFLPLLTNSSVQKISYDLKIMHYAVRNLGIRLAGPCFDTIIAAYLLDPTAAKYEITRLVEQYLEKFPRPDNLVVDRSYAGWAVKALDALWPVLAGKMQAAELTELFNRIEMPLVEVLAALEHCGIKVDVNGLRAMAGKMAIKIDELLTEIFRLAGEQFNVNSTKQLGCILFEKLRLPVMKKTKTGYSTDAEVLEKLAGYHPIIDKLLDYRTLTKLKSTYLDGMEGLINCRTGRIHTTFNQTVTATGRLSSSDPNMQNIPIRTDIGRRIRELFVPDEGYNYILSADYSQIELRILAHMSSDDNLIDAFLKNQDIHTRTAAEVFGVDMDKVTPEMRRRAKAVNFGIIYGISDFGLSRDIGVSRKEAGKYIDSYFARYPRVKDFIDQMVAAARRTGYVTTMFGRRRYLPDIISKNFNQRSFAERTAMNTPIQGTAADIIKKAMIDVYRQLEQKSLRSRIVLQVHDELVLEVPETELTITGKLVSKAMMEAVSLVVPLIVDISSGVNWAMAK